LFGWLAENLATPLAQVRTLLAHARGNTFHTRNFRCTKPKNVTGAETALIVLRKRVTRCWQHCQTKSQTRCDPQIANCEQINWHIVSPELTDVAVATRRLAVLESSVMVSIRASTLQYSQPQVHRNFAPTTQLRSLIWNRRPRLRGRAAHSRVRRWGFPAVPVLALIAIAGERMILRGKLIGREYGLT
jgi:hypothetical protein